MLVEQGPQIVVDQSQPRNKHGSLEISVAENDGAVRMHHQTGSSTYSVVARFRRP